MKWFLLSSIIFSILIIIAGACVPAPIAKIVPSETLNPTDTPTAQPTETPTEAPTAIPTYTNEQLAQMTDEQKAQVLNDAPAIEGLTKDTFSTVKSNLIIYRYASGTAQKVYDLTTGKELTLQEGGIIEIDLTDGTKWEMPAFITDILEDADAETIEANQIATLEYIANFIVEDGVAWGNKGDGKLDDANQETLELIAKANKIPDWKPVGGFSVPFLSNVPDSDKFFVGRWTVKGHESDFSYIIYFTNEGETMKIIYTNIPEDQVSELLKDNKVSIPAKN